MAWHRSYQVFIGSARSCDIGWLGFPWIFQSGGGQDRRRVCDGMHAFVYTLVLCLRGFDGGRKAWLTLDTLIRAGLGIDIHF